MPAARERSKAKKQRTGRLVCYRYNHEHDDAEEQVEVLFGESVAWRNPRSWGGEAETFNEALPDKVFVDPAHSAIVDAYQEAGVEVVLLDLGTYDPYAAENVTPVDRPYEFTAGAVVLLNEEGYDQADYDGPATGSTGKVTKSDVEGWLDEDVEDPEVDDDEPDADAE